LKTAVVIVGLIIALLGLVGMLRPVVLRKLVGGFRATPMLYLAAIIRVALGVLLLLTAPACRYTVAIYVLGVITLFSGLLLPVIGKTRFEALIGWWIARSDRTIRALTSVAIAYGAFLVLAAF
jgi:hypothetical protein